MLLPLCMIAARVGRGRWLKTERRRDWRSASADPRRAGRVRPAFEIRTRFVLITCFF